MSPASQMVLPWLPEAKCSNGGEVSSWLRFVLLIAWDYGVNKCVIVCRSRVAGQVESQPPARRPVMSCLGEKTTNTCHVCM